MVSATDREEVASLEKELAPMAGKEGGDYTTKLKYLKLVRKLNLRKSELVAKYGLDLLNSKRSKSRLGDDLWDVYEQVAVASMDCHNLEIAKECVGALMIRFPNSLRVGRLEGMWLEASGMFAQADKVYSDLLEDHPQDQLLQKRKICILKSQGNLLGAVDSLVKYLEIYMADYEAWRELAEIYVSLQMYKQAAFCFEELLLSSPSNPIFNLQLAEVLYTIGGIENLRLARGYYSAAIEFSDGENLRALYGVCLCASAIQASARSSKGVKAEESSDLPAIAADAIEQIYKKRCPDKIGLVKSILTKLLLQS